MISFVKEFSILSSSVQKITKSVKVSSSNQEASKKPSLIEQFMPFVFILLIIYFLLIRPSQKRAQKHVEFTKNLKKGDSVLTSGGVLGKIDGLTEQYAILEITERVKIRVLRSHISSFSDSSQQKKQVTGKIGSNVQPQG